MTATDHDWLRTCRRLLDRPVTDAEFEQMVPGLMRLRRQLVAAKRRGRAS